MRLSIDTLILLARLGDKMAEHVVLWIYGLDRDPEGGAPRFDAEAWTGSDGRIGAGYPGVSNARSW